MLILSSQPIQPNELRVDLMNAAAGACVDFEGWVRDHNDGRKVIGLEYEAYQELCRTEAAAIFREAHDKFDIFAARCVHRIGRLAIGETSVWIGVSASHRDAAYRASRYIIDEIKHRLPIWKKEYYSQGDSGWVNCRACAHTPTEEQYYSRQVLLPEIGVDGQKKLKDAKVLVVGAGGLGTAALTSLAQAGVGTMGICESDKLDASNLHRQSLYSHEDVGKSKLELATQRLRSINPHIHIVGHPEAIAVENALGIISQYDLILDCTDNFTAKFLINDASVLLKKTLIQTSLYQWEGRLRTYIPGGGSPCLRCLWPEIPPEDCVDNCAQSGILGVTAQIMGHWQAAEAIKMILGITDGLNGHTLIFDLKTNSQQSIRESVHPSCPLCGPHPCIRVIEPANYVSADKRENSYTVSVTQINEKEFRTAVFVDIREPIERSRNTVKNLVCVNLPFSKFEEWKSSFAEKKHYYLLCEKGLRSQKAAEILHEQGHKNIFAIRDGIAAVNLFEEQRHAANRG